MQASVTNCGFLRTISVWRGQEGMFEAVWQGTHLTAINEAPDLSIVGRTTFWEVPADEPYVTWEAALEAVTQGEECGGGY